MRQWFDRLRFLAEEEIAPPEEVPRGAGEESVGVPRPLRTATRFALIGTVATSLMGQVIGIRLVAPVDAAPVYRAQCVQACNDQFKADQASCASLPPSQRGHCLAAATQKQRSCQNSCNGPWLFSGTGVPGTLRYFCARQARQLDACMASCAGDASSRSHRSREPSARLEGVRPAVVPVHKVV